MSSGSVEPADRQQRFSWVQDQSTMIEDRPPEENAPRIVRAAQTLFEHCAIGITIIKIELSSQFGIL